MVIILASIQVSCVDEKNDDWGTYIYHPTNIVVDIDSITKKVTYKWEDHKLESPAEGYYITTYQGLKEEGGNPISEVGEVLRVEGVTSYSYSLSASLLSGTNHEVEIRGYAGDVLGYPETFVFESAMNPDVVGTNTKVSVTATSATFTWLDFYKNRPKKIVVTPNEDELNLSADKDAIVLELEINNPDMPSVTVGDLVPFTGYSAELFDSKGGVIGRYEFKTSMSGGVYVFNSEQLEATIESMATSGGAIMISTKEVGPDYVFEYSGKLPIGDFFLMGSGEYPENADSIATVKLSLTYPDNGGSVNIMRLNIDGQNELGNFIQLEQKEDLGTVVQGEFASSASISLSNCIISNYKNNFITSGGSSYMQIESINVSNLTIANFPHGSLVDFHQGKNSKGEVIASAVKEFVFDRVTIYNIANDGTKDSSPNAEGKFSSGTSLFRIEDAKFAENNTRGSSLYLTNSTIIDVAVNASIFSITDYNYQGKDYNGGLFVNDCLFVDIDESSYSTNVGQIETGYNFKATTSEAANAVSMTTRTNTANLYGANSITGRNPLCGPQVSVTFKDVENLDFTITGGNSSKGNPNIR